MKYYKLVLKTLKLILIIAQPQCCSLEQLYAEWKVEFKVFTYINSFIKNFWLIVLLGVSAEWVKKRDCRSLDPDVFSFVASAEKLLHDAADAGFGRVVRDGQDDSLAVLEDLVFVGGASGLDQGRDESGKNFRLQIEYKSKPLLIRVKVLRLLNYYYCKKYQNANKLSYT